VYVEVDSSRVQQALATIDAEHITTPRALWERISNEQAFLLESMWAPAAGRAIPALMDHMESVGFADVVNTINDLQKLGDALKRALLDVPPAEVSRRDQLEAWVAEYSKAVVRHKNNCPQGVIDKAIDQVIVAITGLRNTQWLDSDDSQHGWIRFEVRDVPT
jgi:hypothetical protein